MKLYKITGPHGEAINGGSGTWKLPHGKRAGAWMPDVAEVRPCERGYHLVTAEQLLQWLSEGVVWEAEGRGDHADCDDKSVWKSARLVRKVGTLNEKCLRLFAADCAKRVLPIYERDYPADDRPRKAITAARNYANGKISDAARDAAWDAAWDAGRAAARSAARAAARAAAWDAARAAGWSAAWSAARAAGRAAARSAACDAAWAAARAAGRDAEIAWQTKRLFWYLIKSRRAK